MAAFAGMGVGSRATWASRGPRPAPCSDRAAPRPRHMVISLENRTDRERWSIIVRCRGRRIMVITQASQACDAGSIPVARSMNFKSNGSFRCFFSFLVRFS